MADMNYDVIVIGGGPGGYVAAIRAAQLGLHTAVIERENLGGICLNWGCIPTKALLRSAEVLHLAKHAADYGLVIQNPSFDLDKVVARSRKVAGQLNGGVKHLLKKNKVAVIDGSANLAGKGTVAVTKGDAPVGTFGAKHIIIATGARARTLPGLEDDGKLVWTYRKAMTPDTMPKSLLVIGSGAIGIEFASFYNALGAKVTVVEVMDRILPVEDEEISAMARKAFEKQGMRIITGGKAGNLRKAADSVTVAVEAGGKTEDI
ncbi:MAG: FAD-dependent oxidoreductase, partial [Alphaproteobacteria bacterium]